MNRRGFLKLAGALPAAGLLPELVWAADKKTNNKTETSENRVASAKRQKTVVLIKLAGGNDGLNTLVPQRDYSLYAKYRSAARVPEHKLKEFPLDNGMSVNPYMMSLRRWWEQGDLAWIQGVGYPHGVLSHFRSSDIWETASGAFEHSEIGWLAQVLPQYKQGLHGIILGEGLGPMAGKDCHTIAMQSPQVFLSQVDLVPDIQPISKGSPALKHVVNIQHQLHAAGEQLKEKMARPQPLGGFATSVLGRKLESVAQMILNDVDTSVYKVEHSGYDTHANQANVHNNLLFELAAALNSFADTMQQHGRWDDVIVMTYSEFGRRVQENRGGGTDHGTASVQLVMGGRVSGGRVYGENPRLKDLDGDGNLHMTTDFRAVYGTLASRWFGVSNPWSEFGSVAFV